MVYKRDIRTPMIPEHIVNKVPTLFEHVQSSFVSRVITYMIDRKYRKTVSLVPWLREQVENASEEMKAYAKTIKTYSNPDRQVVEVLRAVYSELKYYGDTSTWDMIEKWATAEEVMTRWYVKDLSRSNGLKLVHIGWEKPKEYRDAFRADDCETGSTLIYVLCRLKGVPANRLLLMTGDVTGGGHCWLAYKPTRFPLNFVFLDWCYWYSKLTVYSRNLFYVHEKTIYEFKQKDDLTEEVESNYMKLWFAFNEETSFRELKRNR